MTNEERDALRDIRTMLPDVKKMLDWWRDNQKPAKLKKHKEGSDGEKTD